MDSLQRFQFVAKGVLRGYGQCFSTSNPKALFANVLLNRSLYRVSGSKCNQFLQSLMTNDVYKMENGIQYTGFLTAKGRVLFDAFVYQLHGEKDEYIIDVDASVSKWIEDHFKTYNLRSSVKFSSIEDEFVIGSSFECQDIQTSLDTDMSEPRWKDPRNPELGYRRLLKKSEIKRVEYIPCKYYHIRRILLGIPECLTEMTPGEVIPFEVNLDLMNGIDFNKGCYLGQELVTRTKHTGVIRKRTYPVKLFDSIDELKMDKDAPVNIFSMLDLNKALAARNQLGHADTSIPRIIPSQAGLLSAWDTQDIQKGQGSELGPLPLLSHPTKGSGKLLSCLGQYGLAILRVDDVESGKCFGFSLDSHDAKNKTVYIKPLIKH